MLSFILFLKKKLKSPGAVRNYVSSARTWTLAVQGTAEHFDTYNVALLKRGLDRSMKHTPAVSPPIWPEHIEHMSRVLDELGKEARVIKAVLLIGYFTALRQSNLIAGSGAARSTHALKAKDVTERTGELWVTVHTSKSAPASGRARVFKLQRHNSPLCCPLVAWKKYARYVHPEQDGPAFVTRMGTHLTVAKVTKLLRAALKFSSYPAPQDFTLHALRRGAVHACANAGSTLDQIRELGHWRSDAVNHYLPPNVIRDAPTTLRACFG